jgi:uncharacterized membrane protein YccC
MHLVQRPDRTQVRTAVVECTILGLAGSLAYWLVVNWLTWLRSVSVADDIVGGVWAAIATVFVTRSTYEQSVTAAVTRVLATLVSFVLCELYLIFLPFHLWGYAVVLGLSALIPVLAGRPSDAVTAAITTAVLLPLSQLSPHHAWEQPILRLVDTIVGVAVGIAAAWLSRRFVGPSASSKAS